MKFLESRPFAVFALVLAVGVFTGGFVAGRIYYNAGGIPIDVVALRYGVSAILLAPFVLIVRKRLSRTPGWWRAAGLAAVGGVPFGLFVLTGVAGAPVTHGAGLTPGVALVVGTILSRFFLQEPLGVWRLTGLGLALSGLAMLVWPEIGTAGATWWGEAAYIGAGVLWGCFTVALRAWQIKPLDGAALAATFSLPYIPVYLFFLHPEMASVPVGDTILQGLYQGVAFNILAVIVYGWAIGKLGAAAAVAAMPLMPVFGTLMEWSILERIPHILVIPAVVTIAVGVLLATGLFPKTVFPQKT